jgi:hypothetical protein
MMRTEAQLTVGFSEVKVTLVFLTSGEQDPPLTFQLQRVSEPPAMVRQEPKVQLALMWLLGACAWLTGQCAQGFFEGYASNLRAHTSLHTSPILCNGARDHGCGCASRAR